MVWKSFVLLCYSISMLNNDLVLVIEPKRVQEYFEEIAINVFDRQKRYVILLIEIMKLIKKFITINYC